MGFGFFGAAEKGKAGLGVPGRVRGQHFTSVGKDAGGGCQSAAGEVLPGVSGENFFQVLSERCSPRTKERLSSWKPQEESWDTRKTEMLPKVRLAESLSTETCLGMISHR